MRTATLITEPCDAIECGARRLAVACDHGLAELIYRDQHIPWALRLS